MVWFFITPQPTRTPQSSPTRLSGSVSSSSSKLSLRLFALRFALVFFCSGENCLSATNVWCFFPHFGKLCGVCVCFFLCICTFYPHSTVFESSDFYFLLHLSCFCPELFNGICTDSQTNSILMFLSLFHSSFWSFLCCFFECLYFSSSRIPASFVLMLFRCGLVVIHTVKVLFYHPNEIIFCDCSLPPTPFVWARSVHLMHDLRDKGLSTPPIIQTPEHFAPAVASVSLNELMRTRLFGIDRFDRNWRCYNDWIGDGPAGNARTCFFPLCLQDHSLPRFSSCFGWLHVGQRSANKFYVCISKSDWKNTVVGLERPQKLSFSRTPTAT